MFCKSLKEFVKSNFGLVSWQIVQKRRFKLPKHISKFESNLLVSKSIFTLEKLKLMLKTNSDCTRKKKRNFEFAN